MWVGETLLILYQNRIPYINIPPKYEAEIHTINRKGYEGVGDIVIKAVDLVLPFTQIEAS